VRHACNELFVVVGHGFILPQQGVENLNLKLKKIKRAGVPRAKNWRFIALELFRYLIVIKSGVVVCAHMP
jgi:hypothetical protein